MCFSSRLRAATASIGRRCIVARICAGARCCCWRAAAGLARCSRSSSRSRDRAHEGGVALVPAPAAAMTLVRLTTLTALVGLLAVRGSVDGADDPRVEPLPTPEEGPKIEPLATGGGWCGSNNPADARAGADGRRAAGDDGRRRRRHHDARRGGRGAAGDGGRRRRAAPRRGVDGGAAELAAVRADGQVGAAARRELEGARRPLPAARRRRAAARGGRRAGAADGGRPRECADRADERERRRARRVLHRRGPADARAPGGAAAAVRALRAVAPLPHPPRRQGDGDGGGRVLQARAVVRQRARAPHAAARAVGDVLDGRADARRDQGGARLLRPTRRHLRLFDQSQRRRPRAAHRRRGAALPRADPAAVDDQRARRRRAAAQGGERLHQQPHRRRVRRVRLRRRQPHRRHLRVDLRLLHRPLGARRLRRPPDRDARTAHTRRLGPRRPSAHGLAVGRPPHRLLPLPAHPPGRDRAARRLRATTCARRVVPPDHGDALAVQAPAHQPQHAVDRLAPHLRRSQRVLDQGRDGHLRRRPQGAQRERARRRLRASPYMFARKLDLDLDPNVLRVWDPWMAAKLAGGRPAPPQAPIGHSPATPTCRSDSGRPA